MNCPVLSIVIPTRGDFEGVGCNQVLELAGDIEFVIVHPLGAESGGFKDPRVREIFSPVRSEVFQRCMGIINSRGRYIISLDQDQILHPDIALIARNYFNKYPESWVLRSRGGRMRKSESAEGGFHWPDPGGITGMPVSGRNDGYSGFYAKKALAELPIAPLDKVSFDWRYVFDPFRKRRDMSGLHIENFNKKIWRGDLARKAAAGIAEAFSCLGPFKYIPFWCMDRLMGLWLQAQFFEPDAVIGHWSPESLYCGIVDDSQLERKGRFYMAADMMLLKRFPGYGYFWNLFFSHFWGITRRVRNRVERKTDKRQHVRS